MSDNLFTGDGHNETPGPDFSVVQDHKGMWIVWCESDACIEQRCATQKQAETLARLLNTKAD